MTRLKITATLKSNPIIHGDLYLDGVLYSAMRKQQLGGDYYNLQRFGDMQKYSIEKIKLPIQRKNKVYLASKACYKLRQEYMNRWRKRWNELSADQWCELKRVYINQKNTKNYDYPVNVSILRDNKIWWYCIGDKERIIELLNECHGVGKEINQGYGLVDSWCVEPTTHRGVRLFPIIDDRKIKEDEIVIDATVNPPYTRRDKKTKSVYRAF